ncbi:MAG: hypothetical protein KGY75_08895 [Candidatus Cloacimonetes bacterium]|nr:hypothetical protein [Candidatus Cloacimonadota bacterium]
MFLALCAILLFNSVLFCEEKDQSEQQHFHRIGISPGYITSLNLGLGSAYSINNEFREKFTMLHLGTNVNQAGDIIVAGLFVKTNYYKNDRPKGFFFNTSLGMDFIKFPALDFYPGGVDINNNTDGYQELILPNARIGIGYASKFSDTSGLEFNFEVGITAVIMSLNVAYVF